MCGIAGFVDTRGALRAEGLAATGSAMAVSLRHRGPDDCGVWVDPAAGISLAHRRLAILDLSPAGHQPMSPALPKVQGSRQPRRGATPGSPGNAPLGSDMDSAHR